MAYAEELTSLVKRHLPARVILLRRRYGLSQGELAEKAGLGRGTLSQLESGQFLGVRLWTILQLAGVFQSSLDYMAGLDRGPLVRIPTRVGEICPECGRQAPHPFGLCALEMQEKGKSPEYIAARFGITSEAAKFLVAEELRIRRRSLPL